MPNDEPLIIRHKGKSLQTQSAASPDARDFTLELEVEDFDNPIFPSDEHLPFRQNGNSLNRSYRLSLAACSRMLVPCSYKSTAAGIPHAQLSSSITGK